MRRVAIFVGLSWMACITAEGQSTVGGSPGGIEARPKWQTVMLNLCGAPGAGIVVGEDQTLIYVLTVSHLRCKGGQTNLPCAEVCEKPVTVRFFGNPQEEHVVKQIYRDSDKERELNDDLMAVSIDKGSIEKSARRFRFNLARDPSAMRRGDHLFVIGNPNDVEVWFVPPEPFFLARVSAGRIEFGPALQAYGGLSGGALCNGDGEIVGIVQGNGNRLAYAMPITAALQTFEGWHVRKARLFAERRFPVMKPHYTEIGADAIFPSLTNGLSGDGPGVCLHIAHGVTRLMAPTFDATILYARGTFPDVVETQQILIPSGGLQVQPFANLAHKAMHETLGGFYIGGGLGYGFVARSVQGTRVSVKENLSSLIVTTEASYRWPLPARGWGLKFSYRVYQPVRSQGLERATGFALGMYGVFR